MAGQRHILVYAVRHGTTELNQQDCFRGPLDVPLDEQGIRDAHRLKYYFQPLELSFIFASSKQRAAETARIIATPKQLKPILKDSLHAWNVGEFAGKPKSEYGQALEMYVCNPDMPVPGGESLNAFKGRVRPLYRQAMEIGLKTGKPVMVVAHSSLIHEVGAMLHGDHEHTLVEPGGVAAIYVQDGKLMSEPIFKAVQRATSSAADRVS